MEQNSSLIYSVSNLLNMFLRANFSGPVPSDQLVLDESNSLLLKLDKADSFKVKFELDSEHPMRTIRNCCILNTLYLFHNRNCSLAINSALDLV